MLLISMLANAGSSIHLWMFVAAFVGVGSGIVLLVLDKKQRKRGKASADELTAPAAEDGAETDTSATPDN